VEAADALIYDELRARRAEPDLAERTDVLSLLMSARHDDGSAMTDLELRDELVTLLLAGHETTATGLAWAFERLLRNPAAFARLREAVEEDDDDYVDAVVKETLRLRPVILDVARKLAQPVEVGGHALPAGITVMPAIGLVQSAAEHYESPDELRPERFLGGSPAPYTWIPFGGGPRRCLGAAFASYEMRIVLKTVLRLVELEAPDGRPERARLHHITMVPARGGRVRVRAHRAVPARVAA
jgi:cytochrome P450